MVVNHLWKTIGYLSRSPNSSFMLYFVFINLPCFAFLVGFVCNYSLFPLRVLVLTRPSKGVSSCSLWSFKFRLSIISNVFRFTGLLFSELLNLPLILLNECFILDTVVVLAFLLEVQFIFLVLVVIQHQCLCCKWSS